MSDVDVMERNPRLERLLSYLQQDPNNDALRADAASAAIDGHAYDIAAQLLSDGVSAPLRNLKGILALREDRFEDAADIFGRLHETDDDAAVRFNLAWARKLLATKPFKLVAVATANKMARMAFALMRQGTRYAVA